MMHRHERAGALVGAPARAGAWGVPVLRMVIGGLLAYHGTVGLRMAASGAFAGMLRELHVPFPGVFGWVTPAFELVAGLLLVVGLLTRPVGLLIALEMAYTAVWVKLHAFGLGVIAAGGAREPGAELDLLYLAGALAVALLGPGRLSLDFVLGIDRGAEAEGATERPGPEGRESSSPVPRRGTTPSPSR